MGIFKNDDKQSSAFGFDENSMAGKAVKAVRWIYAITGVLALVTGIALLFAPAKSLVFLTTVLGFYFVVTRSGCLPLYSSRCCPPVGALRASSPTCSFF